MLQQGMEELIKSAFLHLDSLERHVNDGHYDLIGPDGEIILPQVWENVVQPGWDITMHMWPVENPAPKSPPPPPPPPPISVRGKEPASRGSIRPPAQQVPPPPPPAPPVDELPPGVQIVVVRSPKPKARKKKPRPDSGFLRWTTVRPASKRSKKEVVSVRGDLTPLAVGNSSSTQSPDSNAQEPGQAQAIAELSSLEHEIFEDADCFEKCVTDDSDTELAIGLAALEMTEEEERRGSSGDIPFGSYSDVRPTSSTALEPPRESSAAEAVYSNDDLAGIELGACAGNFEPHFTYGEQGRMSTDAMASDEVEERFSNKTRGYARGIPERVLEDSTSSRRGIREFASQSLAASSKVEYDAGEDLLKREALESRAKRRAERLDSMDPVDALLEEWTTVYDVEV